MPQDSRLQSSTWKQFFFDRWAPSYDRLFPSIVYQAIHQRMLEFVTLPETCQVLDLGCGTGKLLNRLAQHYPHLRGTGLDFSPAMIRLARQRNQHRPRLLFIQGSAADIPRADASLDAVFSSISFLHYPDPDRVMAEIHRVLKPGCQFYLADLTPGLLTWWWCQQATQPLPISPGGIRLYTAGDRQHLASRAHLECIGHHYLLGPVLLTVFQRP
jgi:ubiquinone/menaquinone biosynthesis C-methylase UbiE